MDALLQALTELVLEDSPRGRAEARDFAEEILRNWAQRTAKKIYRQRWMSDADVEEDDRARKES